MLLMFGFNFDNTVSTRTTVITLVFITCYHTTVALFIFEYLFCLPAKKLIPYVLFSFKLLYLHDFQTWKYHLNYCSLITVFFVSHDVPDSLWGVRDVRCSRCGMSGMWNVADVGCSGCGMFEICSVQDVGCSGCGMFGMWDDGDVGYLWCGMLAMWDVLDTRCSGCGMFEMCDFRDVECGCGMFAGMWDVGLQNAFICRC